MKKTIDLIKINPYGDLPEKKIGVSLDFGTPIYEISQIKLKSANFDIANIDTQNKYINDKSTFRLRSYYEINKNRSNNNFIAFTFTIYITKNTNEVISSYSNVYIYDKNGDLYRSLENINTDIYFPLLTNDGKFLYFNTGNDYSEEEVSNIKNGFSIYNLENSSLVYECENNNILGSTIVQGRYFLISENELKTKSTSYNVIDCYNNYIYFTTIGWGKSSQFIKVDLDGFTFKDDNTREQYNMLYSKDFITKKINEK